MASELIHREQSALCGGSISVESEPGKGTVSTVLLPAVPDTSRLEEPVEQPVIPRGTETILLTRDDPMVRAMVRGLLMECGHHILEAMQGEVALRIAEAQEGPIHLLLTDVVMRTMCGRELALTNRGDPPGHAGALYHRLFRRRSAAARHEQCGGLVD